MLRNVLHSKIHRATVTAALPNYVGSITIDEDFLDATGMRVNDMVAIANCNNGERFETYIFKGARGSRKIELNGAAALLVKPGDKVICSKYAGTEVKLDDTEYLVVRQSDILAVVE